MLFYLIIFLYFVFQWARQGLRTRTNIVTCTICGHDLCCFKYLLQLPAIRFRLASFLLMLHSLLLINSNPLSEFGISSALVHSQFCQNFVYSHYLPTLGMLNLNMIHIHFWWKYIFVQTSPHPEAVTDIPLPRLAGSKGWRPFASSAWPSQANRF